MIELAVLTSRSQVRSGSSLCAEGADFSRLAHLGGSRPSKLSASTRARRRCWRDSTRSADQTPAAVQDSGLSQAVSRSTPRDTAPSMPMAATSRPTLCRCDASSPRRRPRGLPPSPDFRQDRALTTLSRLTFRHPRSPPSRRATGLDVGFCISRWMIVSDRRRQLN